MHDEKRKIRLPQSYLEEQQQKQRSAAAAQETIFSYHGADLPSEQALPLEQEFAPTFSQNAPVFLPEIPASDVFLPQDEHLLHLELPAQKSASDRQPHDAYDHQADGFVPQGNLPRTDSHGKTAAQHRGTPPHTMQPNSTMPNARATVVRRTLPLMDDSPMGDSRGTHAATQPAQTRHRTHAAQKACENSSGDAVAAQAAYRPRHAAAPAEQPAPKQADFAHNPPGQLPREAPPQGRKKKTSLPKKKKKHWFLKRCLAACACLVLLSGAGLAVYLNIATKNDFLWLDLAQLSHRDATVLYASDGAGGWQDYARLEATQQKKWVELEQISTDLQHAFIAIEDQHFYKHNGVSITRTLYAVLNEVKFALTNTYFGGVDGIKQGASTITQQLVKNLTYDNEAGGMEGYFRKIREIYRAYKMDADYEKAEILEAYLNVIGFTGNTAGVQAESMKLFSKTVDALPLEQCASIAAITKNPYRYDPTRNPETHLTRRNYILYEMWQQDYISEAAYNTASAQPIGLSMGAVSVPKTQTTSYFTDKLIEDVSADLAREFGLSRTETTHLLYNGGLRIYTTVDANLQAVMEKNMRNGAQFFPQPSIQASVAQRDENGKAMLDEVGNPIKKTVTETPQAAMVSLGYDGALKAVVGGIGEKDISRGFNRGTGAVRQVGSTMKPIGAYALAVEKNKVHWSTAVMDAPVRKIADDATGEMREWPANFTRTYSNLPVLVAEAMAQSINTVAVRVGERAGVRSIYQFTRNQLGITSFTPEDRAAGPMILGSSTYGVTPYELAGSYMMFGNGGSFTTPHTYTDVQTGYGRSIMQPSVETKQVLAPDTAYVMNRLLDGVMQGNGTAAGYTIKGEMESIGKTGTTSDNRDYWFVGLTPYYVTATWYGYDSGAALNTSQGTHAPTTAWRAVMQQAQNGLPPLDFPVDESVLVEKYCTESGGIAAASCPRTRTGYYRAGTAPNGCVLHAK